MNREDQIWMRIPNLPPHDTRLPITPSFHNNSKRDEDQLVIFKTGASLIMFLNGFQIGDDAGAVAPVGRSSI